MPCTVMTVGTAAIGVQLVVSAWAATAPSVRASTRTRAMRYELVRMTFLLMMVSTNRECRRGDLRGKVSLPARESEWKPQEGSTSRTGYVGSGRSRSPSPSSRASSLQEPVWTYLPVGAVYTSFAGLRLLRPLARDRRESNGM